MSNFGFRRLRVVNPYEIAFREARSAVGAASALASAEEYKSIAEAVADCTLVVGTTAVRSRALHHPLKRLEEGARVIRQRLRASPVALLFGSEKVGLSNHDLSHCHWLLHIPTHPEHVSMNLGQAVAVSLYELARGAKTAQQTNKVELATASEIERITSLLLEAMRLSGYLSPDSAPPSEEKIRRLIRRLNLQLRDAHVWYGILRQIIWKLHSGEQTPAQCHPERS